MNPLNVVEGWRQVDEVVDFFFRYTPATKALDLKYFHTDPIFLNEAMFVPLSRGIIIKNIVKVIFFHLEDLFEVSSFN